MEKSFALHPAQAAIYNSLARFKVVAAGRRFGKSYLACVLCGINALKTEHRGHILTPENSVYYICPTADQAKRNMWRRFRRLWGDCIKSENINDGFFEMVNGRRLYIKGADNEEALRGEGLQFVVPDEYADMKPHVWEDILDPALMDCEGDAMFIGTPKGRNHFYKMFSGALAHDPGYAEWEAFHFESGDNPFITDREIERLLKNPNKTKDVILREIKASFASRTASTLNPDLFIIIPVDPRAIGRPRPTGSIYVTVDLAGFKTVAAGSKVLRSDETVIAITAADEDGWTVLDMKHGHWDPRECAFRIVSACREYPGSRLGIEVGMTKEAVGPYLEDYMRQFNRYIQIEPLHHGGTKKTDRIQWALQGRLERGKIALIEGEWNDWLLEQASVFPDPLAHDDGLDALAYVDQMHVSSFVDASDFDEWEPLDEMSAV